MNYNPEKPIKDWKIAVFGTGAIGATVGAWLSEIHRNIVFIDQGEVARALKEEGISLYHGDSPRDMKNYEAKLASDLSEIADADLVITAVKNYSLGKVAELIRNRCGDHTVILSLANGIENQRILPEYFSRVIYGVVSYNAWMDKPVTVGYQKKGPLIIGTPDNSGMELMKKLAEYFSPGVETVATDELQAAAHSKIVINLTNAVTTLIGHGYRDGIDQNLFQRILPNTLYEGVRVLDAAGIPECRLGGMPSWGKLKAGATLPLFLTRGLFRRNVAKMQRSSMSQDIIGRHAGVSELESLTGYIIKLAEKNGVDVPFNRTIYRLCKERFAMKEFEPMQIEDVWKEIQIERKV